MKRIAVSLVLCLAACASEPERELAPGYLQSTFTPPFSVLGEWSHVADDADGRATRGQHLTRHGLSLDRVWILSGVRPGQRIVEASAPTADGPEWAGNELKGLVEGSLWALGYGGVGWQDTPVSRQGKWGPLVAFNTVTERGLDYRGALRARRKGDELDLVVWIAEAGVYAPRTETDATAMLQRLD